MPDQLLADLTPLSVTFQKKWANHWQSQAHPFPPYCRAAQIAHTDWWKNASLYAFKQTSLFSLQQITERESVHFIGAYQGCSSAASAVMRSCGFKHSSRSRRSKPCRVSPFPNACLASTGMRFLSVFVYLGSFIYSCKKRDSNKRQNEYFRRQLNVVCLAFRNVSQSSDDGN